MKYSKSTCDDETENYLDKSAKKQVRKRASRNVIHTQNLLLDLLE